MNDADADGGARQSDEEGDARRLLLKVRESVARKFLEAEAREEVAERGDVGGL